ncbi:hypothetical protein [Novosphingobium sp.]|jgi:hypothetical protein|uniref:hypothetical protein n=1 Tax=Novosphingobium sp. TaxID=1874826 RepID=UPI001ECFFB2E|nr:hypothetical protein [Novosphingobium sp.]MBK6801657.1 hypothetical protein [Novosphingobium sp.]MBK9009974.1 hypothetical protein [Novosphingobium sp.]
MLYSATTRGFYVDGDQSAPSDAVKISATRHAALLDAEAQGHLIEPDAKGRPQIRTRAVDIAAQRALLITAIKAEAGRRIRAVCPVERQLNLMREGRGDEVAALVDPLRERSNALEARANAAGKAWLDEFDPTRDAHWQD